MQSLPRDQSEEAGYCRRREGLSYTRTVFDPASGRFFLVASGRSFNTGEPTCIQDNCAYSLFLAVSRVGSPASLTPADWHLYRLPDTELRAEEGVTRQLTFTAFSMIGITSDSVVISSLLVSARMQEEATARLRVLDKAALLRGDANVSWTDVLVPDQIYMPAPSQPVEVSESLFMVSSPGGGRCDLTVWELRGPWDSPSLLSRTAGASGYCDHSRAPEEPGGLFVDRVFPRTFPYSQPARRGSRIFGAHTVARGDGAGAQVRWFELDLTAWPSAVRFADEGRIGEPGQWSFYPSVAADPAGGLAVVYVRTSATEFGSAYYAIRRAADPPGSTQAPVRLAAGQARWGHDRFGYYIGAASDPSDGTSWLLGAYVHSYRTWGTRIAHLPAAVASPPAPQAEAAFVGGYLPVNGGIGLIVYRPGGSMAELEAAARSAGCSIEAVWRSTSSGEISGYIYGAPDFVNAQFFAALPNGVLRTNEPLLLRCAPSR